MPGDALLSHGEAPHYHRRGRVSLLSSGWDQVGPRLYGRQAKLVNNRICKFFFKSSEYKLLYSFTSKCMRYTLLFFSLDKETQTPWALYGQASRAISIG